MKTHDCFWAVRAKKIFRMNSKTGYKEDIFKIIERDDASRYKKSSDKRGIKVSKMILEKSKKELAKKMMSKNMLRNYTDKCLESITGL